MKTKDKLTVFRGFFNTGTHGCSGECHCGALHYDDGNEWDEDHHERTLPNARKAAEEDPKSYQFHDSAIEYLEFNECLFVIDCKCGMDKFIFGFLNENKSNVLSYYKQTQEPINVNELF